MLPAIVLSRGCKEPSHRTPSKSTRTISDIRRLISDGAILVIGKGFWKHFREQQKDIPSHRDLHHYEIRKLTEFARHRNRLWYKEDIPGFVSNEKPEQKAFKYIQTIFLQSKEYGISEEWKNLAFSKGFEIEGYDVEIRTLSQGVEDIHTTFSIPINKNDQIDSVGHHIRPLIHWSSSITVYDGYCIENHGDSLKNKGTVSGLSNFFKWVVDERKKMNLPLNRIRIISRQRSKTGDIRDEMKLVLGDLVAESKLETVVKASSGNETGIFVGFRPDSMGERYVVFENHGYSLAYSFGSKCMAMLQSNLRKKKVQKNFDLSGPTKFIANGTDGHKLISDMKNQGKFIPYPFS